MKASAVPNGAPPDDRRVEPVAAEALAGMKEARDDFERMKIARILLTESMRRLRAGRTLERAHGVVHPELTCIIRDVERLSRIVFPGSSAKRAEVEAEVEQGGVELSEGAASLAALVARSSSAKVARLAGLTSKRIAALAAGEALPTDAERSVLASRLRVDAGSWEP
jgi:hypothetical protein